MKTITLLRFMCIAFMSVTTLKTFAQQQANSRPSNPGLQQIHNGKTAGNFTTRTFLAPNKSYGYDILSNGKVIFHQPAFSISSIDNNLMLTTKEQANVAAMVAIEKIKKGINPELSRDELKKIAAH